MQSDKGRSAAVELIKVLALAVRKQIQWGEVRRTAMLAPMQYDALSAELRKIAEESSK